MSHGNLFIISAPSGAGKTSLVKALAEETDNLLVSISHTTRPMRDSEMDGVNYHFVPKEQFNEMIGQGAFLEHANVFGNLYGTSEAWVREMLAKGKDVILEIDWQGAEQVRRLMPNCVGIFILPPSKDTLNDRLHSRGQDSEEMITKRLSEAREEISHYGAYDYLIVNDVFGAAVADIQTIIQASRFKMEAQAQNHQELLQELLS